MESKLYSFGVDCSLNNFSVSFSRRELTAALFSLNQIPTKDKTKRIGPITNPRIPPYLLSVFRGVYLADKSASRDNYRGSAKPIKVAKRMRMRKVLVIFILPL